MGCSGFFGVEGCSIEDPYHTNLDRSVSGFDLTHIFSGSILYALPIGTGKALSTGNRIVDYVIGNWQINTLAIARSGTPFNISYSADTGNTGNILGVRPNVVGSPNLPNPSPQRWFNTQAFAAPLQYTFGTSDGMDCALSPSGISISLSSGSFHLMKEGVLNFVLRPSMSSIR